MIALRVQYDRFIARLNALVCVDANRLWQVRFLSRALLAAALALFTMVPASGPSSADSSIKSRLVGTWLFVSSVNTRKDGSNYDRWGAKPSGILMFDANGRYSQIIVRSEPSLFGPKSVFSFGTYVVDETNAIVITEVEGGSLNKLTGVKQRRQIKLLTADELRYVNLDGVAGAQIDATWKRAPAHHPHSASLMQPQ